MILVASSVSEALEKCFKPRPLWAPLPRLIKYLVMALFLDGSAQTKKPSTRLYFQSRAGRIGQEPLGTLSFRQTGSIILFGGLGRDRPPRSGSNRGRTAGTARRSVRTERPSSQVGRTTRIPPAPTARPIPAWNNARGTPSKQDPRANGPIHGTSYPTPRIDPRADHAHHHPIRTYTTATTRTVSIGPWALEPRLSPIDAHPVPGCRLAKGDGGVQCAGE